MLTNLIIAIANTTLQIRQPDNKTLEYDLALLRFYDKVDFQPNVVPICVPETKRDLVGETAWVTGWGRLYEG